MLMSIAEENLRQTQSEFHFSARFYCQVHAVQFQFTLDICLRVNNASTVYSDFPLAEFGTEIFP